MLVQPGQRRVQDPALLLQGQAASIPQTAREPEHGHDPADAGEQAAEFLGQNRKAWQG